MVARSSSRSASAMAWFLPRMEKATGEGAGRALAKLSELLRRLLLGVAEELVQPLQDRDGGLRHRRARGEDGGHAHFLQRREVLGRDDAAHHHHDVLAAQLLQLSLQLW